VHACQLNVHVSLRYSRAWMAGVAAVHRLSAAPLCRTLRVAHLSSLDQLLGQSAHNLVLAPVQVRLHDQSCQRCPSEELPAADVSRTEGMWDSPRSLAGPAEARARSWHSQRDQTSPFRRVRSNIERKRRGETRRDVRIGDLRNLGRLSAISKIPYIRTSARNPSPCTYVHIQ
jgi:hypothetical protein